MSQAGVDISVRKPVSGIGVLDLRGELTGPAEEALLAAYDTASGGATHTIALNFAGLQSMDSAGMALLIRLLALARRQKQRLVAYGLTGQHRQVFELTHLDEALGLYADEAEALGGLGR